MIASVSAAHTRWKVAIVDDARFDYRAPAIPNAAEVCVSSDEREGATGAAKRVGGVIKLAQCCGAKERRHLLFREQRAGSRKHRTRRIAV